MVKRKVIEDIVSNECDGRSCILKEIVEHSGLRDYILEQFKCMEVYKLDESKREGKDIGWDEATRRWVNSGMAEKYAKVYEDGLTFRELYRRTKHG
jgi:hypothetical protein